MKAFDLLFFCESFVLIGPKFAKPGVYRARSTASYEDGIISFTLSGSMAVPSLSTVVVAYRQ